MMHVGLGRAHPLHIEYIHIGVCLSFIQDILTEAILSHPRLPLQRKIALVKALSKVIWIQNDLFAKWYVRDGDEFKGEDTEEEIVIEKEGYLHGKKILAYDEESEGGESSDSVQTEINAAEAAKPQAATAPSGGCPFSSMAKGMDNLAVGDENKPEKKEIETDASPPTKENGGSTSLGA